MFSKSLPLVNNVHVSATFEHQGVAYEQRFKTYKGFINKVNRGKDTFINAVDYGSMKVIYPRDLS